MITPSLGRVILDIIESELMDLHVSLPGKIQAYDNDTQTADIEIQVKHVIKTDDGGYTTEEMPILPNVPVSFSRSADYFVSFPLTAGDTGLVIFSELSIDQWRSIGNLVAPGYIGRHTIAGGVFIPGLVSNDKALTGNSSSSMMMGHNTGAKIEIEEKKITINTHLTVEVP